MNTEQKQRYGKLNSVQRAKIETETKKIYECGEFELDAYLQNLFAVKHELNKSVFDFILIATDERLNYVRNNLSLDMALAEHSETKMEEIG